MVRVMSLNDDAHPTIGSRTASSSIGGIDVSAQNISCEGWDRSTYDCNQDLAEGFRRMLETSIIKAGKMDVMERGQLTQILEEQGLAASGLTAAGGGLGGLTGVDYLVIGSVTRFGATEDQTSVSTSSGVGSLLGRRGRQAAGGGLSTSKLSVSMGVDLKVTDVASGRIVVADEVSGTVETGSAFSVGGVQQSSGSADPFADVQRVVATRIAEAIVTSRIPVKVIGVQGDGVLVLNYGDVFFGVGDVLAAYSVGESFVDPDTGEVLGSDEQLIGQVEIVSTTSKLSRARPLDDQAYVAGAVLRRIPKEATESSSKRKKSGSAW
ncbi:MAG: hypothetical protein F4029_06270 [Gammaproteobacteria bacterium]|nr:hypothetical protein [Gammaproteobacteria bacterium]MYK45816.1 hypothetical protein [Gammaproteobacteria bacterium]